MTTGVVDHLELVEVDVQKYVIALAALRGGHGRLEARVEFAAVDEAGERVMTRLVGQRAFQAPLLRHVAEHDHGTDGHALAIADRGRGFLDGELFAAPVHEHVVVGRHRSLAPGEHAIEHVCDGFARGFVDELQDIADRAAARLVDRPASETFGDGIQVIDVCGRVRGDHRVADRLQRDSGAILFREDRLLRALALSDVGNRPLVTDDAA
jgi:hypothetical protein